jgi:tetratricopeptide (TPR) repeat protein
MMLPGRLTGLPLGSLAAPARFLEGAVEYHLQPHYRSQRPLDALLVKTAAGSDEFVSEKYADQIGAILNKWGTHLLEDPGKVDPLERVIASGFIGASFQPTQSRRLRSHAGLQVDRRTFSPSSLPKDEFVSDLRKSLGSFSRLLTSEMQVVEITASSPTASGETPAIRTRVRYDFVGGGHDTYREQRVGNWDLGWKAENGEFRLTSWQCLDETYSRATAPTFAEITSSAFSGVASYESQLLHGVDYWRTVLDGASGIDIYGHNGVSVGDIDGDGYDDLYVCQPAGLPNRLFRNRGDGTFEDITEKSGVGLLENTACALFADIDNDSHQDLIVVRTNGPLLFLNDGNGRFRQKPDAFRFAKEPAGTFTGAAIADYDRDGWLDIYFCLYIYYQGADQYKYPTPYYDAENGPPNFMMRNNRDGTFHDVTASTHLNQNNRRYSFCCAWNDFDGDGWPDLYVVNDFGRKNLYRNNGDGTFTDIAASSGTEDTGAGMGVCCFDYDNDGSNDLYVADMWTAAGKRIAMQDVFQKDAPESVRSLYRKHAMGNSLFRNVGNRKFQDESSSAGVELGRWAWSSDAWDSDHDGFSDLYVVNGMVSGPSREDLNSFFWRQVVAKSPVTAKSSHEYEQGWSAINELIRADGTWSGYERNVFYANNGDGTFTDISGTIGLDFVEDGRSFALADFDHDGRLELLVKNRSSPQIRLLQNVIKDLAPAISFRLQGTKSNRDAIGATVTIHTNKGNQTRTIQAGSGFLSQHSKEIFFGLGDANGSIAATIRWPSGLIQELRDLPPNHRISVEEGSAPSRLEAFDTRPKPLAPPAAVRSSESLPTEIETWLLEPILAPDFSLQDLSGRNVSLKSFAGTTVVLYLWAATSADSVSGLEKLERQFDPGKIGGSTVIAVNVDQPDLGRLRSIAQEKGLHSQILRGSEDFVAVYNILYRYLFDRHRDLTIPTSFLITEGQIVKVYQGAVKAAQVDDDLRRIPRTTNERVAKALPFPGVTTVSEFSRNYLSYGSVFFQRGYMEPAQSSFEKALHDDPTSAEALYGLGSVYLQQQNAAEARQAFERATKATAAYPDTIPNAWNNLGLLATREGRTADAIPYFQQALAINPDHLIALENLGNAYRQEKQWKLAQTTLEHAVEVGPDDPEANYSLGMVYAQLNQTDRAYERLQTALKLRPNYPEALNNLGILYLRTQRPEQAIQSLEECIRVAPAFDQCYLNLARVYAVEGQTAKAREILESLLAQHPDHPAAKRAIEELSQ